PLTNLAAALSGSGAGQFTTGTLGATTLNSGDSTTVTVTYLATQTGVQSAAFSVTSNDPVTPSFDTAISGTGLAIDGTFISASQPLISANNYYASGIPINLALGFAPQVGTSLTIVSNTGAALISGTYSNLAQGQIEQLVFNGVTYDFIVNYFGGSGNDLVLEWATTSPVAWGLNGDGQLGIGGTANSFTPIAVDTASPSSLSSGTVSAFAAGSTHSLALTSAGALSAWGDNTYGELGVSGTAYSLIPIAVDSSTDSALNGKTVVAVTAGSIHSLALCSDGSLASWGYGADGELGTGGTAGSFVPVAVDSSTTSALSGKTVKAISAGSFHNLVLCTDGSVIAWGYNVAGQLGTGGTGNSAEPVVVSGTSGSALFGKTVVSVAAGRDFSLALCSDGSVAAWGDNSAGQLGYTGTASTLTPVAVDSSSSSALYGKTVVAIAAGGYHSLALCSDGTVVAWGYNGIGELGNGAMVSSTLPVAVSTASALGGKTVTAVAAGLFHSLAYCSDGSVAAWGWDQYGQLGDGASVLPYSDTPVGVDTSGFAPGSEFYSIYTGPAASHTLALAAAPAYGQLVTYTVTPSVTSTNGALSPSTPQTVSSGSSVPFTATPGSGYAVSQWLVNGQVAQTVGDSYTVPNVTANTSVSVSFAPVPKISAVNAGVYEGLFLDGSNSGFIRVNLSANGKFSSKVTIDGASRTISGAFNASGLATTPDLTLQLAGGAGGTPGSYFINGSYDNANPLTAWHAAYAKGGTAVEAGTYSVQVAAVSRASGVPQNKSTVTLVISKSGAVKFSGKLPDGQSFSTTATITGGPSGNQIFIDTPLAYKNPVAGQRGFLTGDLGVNSGAVNGPLLWNKPAQKNGDPGFATGLIITQ
ncbi:MAG TPA: hypothetical protein VHY22_10635, partial [Chthoniobacteraceae bacterium]|nr:hypothetical protein [Chthoniobacteraceae bacterium]